jgi:4'-phosphopantetheinyl transferase EntD
MVGERTVSGIRPSQIWQALLPPSIAAYETLFPVDTELLFDAERRCVENAVPKRVAEFAAGRLCARRALADLGHVDFVLLRAADRRPLWPEGIAGSITHTDDYCAAVAVRQTGFASLGIDAERIDRFDDSLLRQICTPTERARLFAMPLRQRQEIAALTFSAKEAFYKCHSSAGGGALGFQDAEVLFAAGRFVLHLLQPDALWPAPPAGTYKVKDGMVFCAIARARQ